MLLVVGQTVRLHTHHTELSLAQLEKYQNYTVQVSGLTRVGEGARARSVYCRTNEDLPSPPSVALTRWTSFFAFAWRCFNCLSFRTSLINK